MKDYELKKRELFVLQGGHCYNCDEELDNTCQIDHILPKKRASKTKSRNPRWIDEIFNLRLLCPRCHLQKRPVGFADWDIKHIDEALQKGSVSYADLSWIEDKKLRIHFQKTLKNFFKNT